MTMLSTHSMSRTHVRDASHPQAGPPRHHGGAEHQPRLVVLPNQGSAGWAGPSQIPHEYLLDRDDSKSSLSAARLDLLGQQLVRQVLSVA